jgi:1-phosphofructokinase family hexose kinase
MRKPAKPTVYFICANPALDLSGHASQIIPNEKNYVYDTRIDPGGNAINAARIASRLGVRPLLFGFAGGASGQQLKDLLDREKINHRLTRTRGATRTNVTVTNDSTHQQTRFTFPGPQIRGTEIDTFLKSLGKVRSPGLVVLGGSSPPGCPRAFYPSLVHRLQKLGTEIIVDAPVLDLREILTHLKQPLLLIKPNLTELEHLAKKSLTSQQAILKEARKLSVKAKIVCVSLGENGALVVFEKKTYFFQSPKVKVRGTVGAGDSMVGAIASQLGQTEDRSENTIINALLYGVAAGAATATTEGTSLGKTNLIRKLLGKVQVRAAP